MEKRENMEGEGENGEQSVKQRKTMEKQWKQGGKQKHFFKKQRENKE